MDEERLIVALEARVSDFEKKMRRAERSGTRSYTNLRRHSRSATVAMERDMARGTTSINRALAATGTRIGAFGRTMAAGLAGGLVATVAAGITGSMAQVVKGIASVGDEAKRSGLAAKDFQEWKFVAEQNRIGVDSLVDGFKELQLRADEFIVTGKGPAAEAFQRISLSADDLKRGLKDPSELMLEIIGRMEDLDKAAQIRVADELFGGSGGERFVELLSQGEAGLRRTVRRAHEVGAVMDDEMIEKAAELDRRFGEIATQVGNIGKGLAVGVADVIESLADTSTKLADFFDSVERGRAILGEGVAGQLEQDSAALEEHADSLRGLEAGYRDMARSAEIAAGDLERAAVQLRAWGENDIADTLVKSAAGMRELAGEMDDGTISADEFEDRLGDVATAAKTALDRLSDVDAAEFGGVIASIGGLITALSSAIERAATLRDTLPADPMADPGGGPTGRRGHRSGRQYSSRLAVTTSLRPKAAPPMTAEVLGPNPAGGGKDTGGGGGSSRENDYQREVASIREKTAALEAEAFALVAAAASGRDYGDAVEYARARANLLHQAQEAGLEITPKLSGEIDQLAAGYVQAAQQADQLRDRIDSVKSAQEEFKATAEDAFKSFVKGTATAREALGMLLDKLSDMALTAGFDALSSLGKGGGGGAKGGGLLGGLIIPGILHSGGIAGRDGYGHSRAVTADTFAGAPRYHSGGIAGLKPDEVPAILQRGERVIPKGAVQQAEAMSVVQIDLSEGLIAEILQQARGQSVQIMRQGMMDYSTNVAPGRQAQIARDPRRRG